MTHHGTRPTRHNTREWTAYESRRYRDTGFDYDGHSCMHGRGIWPTHMSDIEELTILSGLSDE